ncbi:rCG41141 [Rattus norvegicus]|uniref:RCG41141 n=1 Tax=Rattus norvegicus TaxID=10116 RepID=A6KIK5_RAT|nr:rCG41141 [Rattus norvegicus]
MLKRHLISLIVMTCYKSWVKFRQANGNNEPMPCINPLH